MSRRFIKGAHIKRGALHRQLGIPAGQRIPDSTLRRCAKAAGKLGRRCRLAQTLRKLSRRRKRKKGQRKR